VDPGDPGSQNPTTKVQSTGLVFEGERGIPVCLTQGRLGGQGKKPKSARKVDSLGIKSVVCPARRGGSGNTPQTKSLATSRRSWALGGKNVRGKTAERGKLALFKEDVREQAEACGEGGAPPSRLNGGGKRGKRIPLEKGGEEACLPENRRLSKNNREVVQTTRKRKGRKDVPPQFAPKKEGENTNQGNELNKFKTTHSRGTVTHPRFGGVFGYGGGREGKKKRKRAVGGGFEAP